MAEVASIVKQGYIARNEQWRVPGVPMAALVDFPAIAASWQLHKKQRKHAEVVIVFSLRRLVRTRPCYDQSSLVYIDSDVPIYPRWGYLGTYRIPPFPQDSDVDTPHCIPFTDPSFLLWLPPPPLFEAVDLPGVADVPSMEFAERPWDLIAPPGDMLASPEARRWWRDMWSRVQYGRTGVGLLTAQGDPQGSVTLIPCARLLPIPLIDRRCYPCCPLTPLMHMQVLSIRVLL